MLAGIILINFIFSKSLKNDLEIKGDKIKVPEGYSASVILKGLKSPTSIAIDELENIYIAENIKDKGRVIEYTQKGIYSVVIPQTENTISNIALHEGGLYISQKGEVSKFENGEVKDLVNGLPSLGDYSNNGIAFGNDGLIYVCQGSATNSGIVGIDNYDKGWLMNNTYFHDYPPFDTVLGGKNFKSKNPLSANQYARANTGAFLPFNTISIASEAIKGRLPGNACVFRITPSGNVVDTFTWGIRNPMGIVILPDSRVFISAQGMEDRGSRPIANGKDYIYEIKKGAWLGWPDYEGGDPVVLNKFKVKNQASPEFIMELHPTTNPTKPIVSFAESGRIGIMDICNNGSFGMKNNLFIPFKKGKNEAAKIVAFDIKNNKTVDFVTNSKDSDFLSNPVQCCFARSGNLYIVENSKGLVLEISKKKNIASSLIPGSIGVEYFIGAIILAFALYLGLSIRRKPSGGKEE